MEVTLCLLMGVMVTFHVQVTRSQHRSQTFLDHLLDMLVVRQMHRGLELEVVVPTGHRRPTGHRSNLNAQ